MFYRGCRTFSLVVLYTTVQTKIDSSLSKIADLISGVVQSSGIGPLTFLTYVNEPVSVLEQRILY